MIIKYLKKYYKIWLPIFSIFLFIGMAELICRGFNLTEKMDADFKFYIHTIDNDLEVDFNIEDPLLMWSPKPGYDDGRVKINSEGFRDKEYNTKKDKNVFRILALGDSSTFGLNVNLEETYHFMLENKLNKELGSQNIHYEVINGGVTGYTSYQGLNLYKYKGAKYRPDIVTFYFGINDPKKSFYPDDKGVIQNNLPMSIQLITKNVLLKLSSYRLLRKTIFNILNRNNYNKELVPRVSKEEFKKNILELDRLTKKNDILLVLISPPLCKERANELGRTKYIIEYRKELENIAREYRIPLINIKELTEYSESSTIDYFIDVVHPNKLGHKMIMENLYAYLISNNFMPADSSSNS